MCPDLELHHEEAACQAVVGRSWGLLSAALQVLKRTLTIKFIPLKSD